MKLNELELRGDLNLDLLEKIAKNNDLLLSDNLIKFALDVLTNQVKLIEERQTA